MEGGCTRRRAYFVGNGLAGGLVAVRLGTTGSFVSDVAVELSVDEVRMMRRMLQEAENGRMMRGGALT